MFYKLLTSYCQSDLNGLGFNSAGGVWNTSIIRMNNPCLNQRMVMMMTFISLRVSALARLGVWRLSAPARNPGVGVKSYGQKLPFAYRSKAFRFMSLR